MRTFERGLAVVGAAALGVRATAAFTTDGIFVQGDAEVFHGVARKLAAGEGFEQAARDAPTAEHAPGWEVVLAAANLVGGDGFLSHRLVGAVLGTITVVLIGLLARRLTGSDAVGLTAGGLAAVYPMLWSADISLMSETLYGVFLVAALLAAAHRRPVLLGVLLGLAALTRGEALLLVPLLAVPLLWRQWRSLALAVVAFALVLTPWTVRNLVTFEEPVLISSNANGIWAGAYCEDVFSGELIGYWRFQCYSPERPGEDESQFFARQREQGVAFLRDNVDRLPGVMGVRLLRLLDLWSVDQAVYINSAEGRRNDVIRPSIYAAWAMMLLAVAGLLVLLRRRRRPSTTLEGSDPLRGVEGSRALLVLLAPVAMVVAVALVTYGTTRFRFAAEPSFCVLAAVALVAAFRTLMTQFHVTSSRSPGTRVTLSRGQ